MWPLFLYLPLTCGISFFIIYTGSELFTAWLDQKPRIQQLCHIASAQWCGSTGQKIRSHQGCGVRQRRIGKIGKSAVLWLTVFALEIIKVSDQSSLTESRYEPSMTNLCKYYSCDPIVDMQSPLFCYWTYKVCSRTVDACEIHSLIQIYLPSVKYLGSRKLRFVTYPC